MYKKIKKGYIYIYIICSLIIIGLCSCKKEIYIVYQCDEESGYIVGDINQCAKSIDELTEVEAVPKEGYRFIGWSDGVLSSKRKEVELINDTTITANFEKIEYVTYNYKTSDEGYIVGSTEQTVEVNEDLSSVTAVAKDGYRFTGWSDGVLEETRTDVNVTEDKTLIANFELINYYTINYICNGDYGYIIGNSSQTVETIDELTEVEAVAKEDYRFIGWSDGILSSKRKEAELNSDITITANFEKIEYVTYNYISTVGGKILGQTIQTVEKGKNLTEVIAYPLDGYYFVAWSDDNTNSKRIDCNVLENQEIVAIFKSVYTVVTYSVNGLGGYIDGQTYQKVKSIDELTSVTAIAKEGYRFIGWDDGIETQSRIEPSLEEDILISVTFAKEYELIIVNEYEYAGTLSGETKQTLIEGESSTKVCVSSKLGYTFSGWSNEVLSDELVIEMPNHDLIIYSYFSIEYLDLPVININTTNNEAITSKEEYLNCSISVLNTEEGYELDCVEGKIRGRGNSSWSMPKKGYKLKFSKKQNLFGNGKNKTWTLIANYCDPSLMRNYLAYTLGKDIDSASVTSTQYVDLYINNEYLGVYLVCEQIEVDDNRVEISEELTPDTGWLIEMDGRLPEDSSEILDETYFKCGNYYYGIKSPELDEVEDKSPYIDFIKNYINNSYSAIINKDFDLICEYIDIDSFVSAYIIHELFNCCDVGYSSFYLYKDKGGKLICGPLWDFDISSGNCNYKEINDPTDLWGYSNPWYYALLQVEEFKNLVGCKLGENKEKIEENINIYCNYVIKNYNQSMVRNFKKWNILGKYVWPNTDEIVSITTWEGQVDYLKNWLLDSLKFLTEYYNQSTNEINNNE